MKAIVLTGQASTATYPVLGRAGDVWVQYG